MSDITKNLSLIPLTVLNEVLVKSKLHVESDKSIAVIKVGDLINMGHITLDQVKATKPSPINRTGAVPDLSLIHI